MRHRGKLWHVWTCCSAACFTKTCRAAVTCWFVGGDFRQVLLVMPHSAREDIVGHSIKSANLWINGLVSVHSLATNMRARGDEEWREYLLRVGDGTEPVCESISPFAVRVPDRILAPRQWTHADLARRIFPARLPQLNKAPSPIARQSCFNFGANGLCSLQRTPWWMK